MVRSFPRTVGPTGVPVQVCFVRNVQSVRCRDKYTRVQSHRSIRLVRVSQSTVLVTIVIREQPLDWFVFVHRPHGNYGTNTARRTTVGPARQLFIGLF